MTNEESMQKLQGCLHYAKVSNFRYMTVSIDALEVAVQALEKQIPDKWLHTDECTIWDGIDEFEIWKCPKCEEPNYSHTKYCPNCGQRLNWIKEDN